MKRFLCLLMPLLLQHLTLLSQNSEKGYLGINIKLGPGKEYIEVIKSTMGWPAEIYGVKAGWRIYTVDGKAVKDAPDPDKAVDGAPGTWVTLSGKKPGPDSLFTIKLPRISVPPDNDHLSEGYLAAHLYTQDQVKYMNNASIAVLHDEESDMLQYKSFDFDYTDAADPLLEKEIFRLLEQRLITKGLVRDKNNPDILILMKTFAGQKEQYIQPEQIISTRVQTIYNWRWGLVPMPITESQTRQGYTDVTYLYSISLKFLDAKRISSSKLPPVIWSASYSEAAKKKVALLDKADNYFGWLLWQYPVSWFHNADCYYGINYAWTGIIYSRKDLNTVSEVIPGSPAYEAGIRKGDRIRSIMDEKIATGYDNPKDGRWLNVLAKWGKLTAFRYLYIYEQIDEWPWGSGKIFKPYKEGTPEALTFSLEQPGKKTTLTLKPLKKQYLSYYTIR